MPFQEAVKSLIHYIFAGLFFAGSLFAIVYFSSNKERFVKALVCVGVVLGMAGHFLVGWYSLFWAEWIGMLPITMHFALESLGKID